MLITNNQLYRDTFSFFYQKIKLILIVSLFAAFLTSYIDYLIIPNVKNIYALYINESFNTHSLITLVKDMNQDQQKILFKYSILRSISSLIGNTILAFGIIILINYITLNKQFNILLILRDCIIILPNLFLLILLITCIVQLGFMLLIIPGILFSILCSFAPIILIRNKQNMINSLQYSVKISCELIKLLTFPISIWLFSKFILLTLDSISNGLPETFFSFILNVCTNIITSILIIYLYRLYILLPISRLI